MSKQSLVDAISAKVDEWLAKGKSRIGHVEWVKGREGEVYIRYNSYLEQFDLASFSILPKYRKKGVAKAIISMAVTKPIKKVRIENILVPEWAEKVMQYSFAGRKTRVVEEGTPSVIFEQE